MTRHRKTKIQFEVQSSKEAKVEMLFKEALIEDGEPRWHTVEGRLTPEEIHQKSKRFTFKIPLNQNYEIVVSIHWNRAISYWFKERK